MGRMRYLVAGGSGFLGSHLIARLRDDGHQVTQLVRRAPRSSDQVEWQPAEGVLDPEVVAQLLTRTRPDAALNRLSPRERDVLALMAEGLGNTAIAVTVSQDGARAVMAIRDSGPGIPEEIAEKITEPFFTTKLTGEGLGLGLSISRAILEDYHGTLAFAPARGGGTLTTVALPLMAAHAPLETSA